MTPREIAIEVLIFVLALILTLQPSAIAQKRTQIRSVKRSNIISEVSERAKRSPSLTPVELAAYGNDRIARKGFDYRFDICDLLENRNPTSISPAEFMRNYQMTLTEGGKLTFRFAIENPYEALCGECWAEVPSLHVTNKEMALIADGRRYRVRRPPSFILDEVQLVDETLKKVLRTWQLPYQTIPIGISADGTKLYLSFYTQYELDHLVLEVSENGPPQFRDRAVIKSSEGKWIEDHPKDPNNGYLSFVSFRVGEKSYRIKFWGPCT